MLKYGIMVLAAFLFVAHFTVTALYLTPLNPVKLRLYPYMQAWMSPLFTQNWHLFAPNPVASNYSLVTKCRSGAVESDWINVSHAVLDSYYHNRLSTAKAIGGIQINAILSIVYGGLPTTDLDFASFCLSNPEHAFCNRLADSAIDEVERAKRILAGMAKDGCMKAIGNEQQLDEVFIRIINLVFPRFSERLKPDTDGNAIVHDHGWHPVP